MGLTLAQKIIKNHIVSGEMTVGSEIGLKIDQTLTQDATGTMAYLEFEAMGVPRVKTERSVAYIDHNTLQTGFENADDHRFIQSIAKKHGIWFSRPGNGICHQVHLERFGIPDCFEALEDCARKEASLREHLLPVCVEALLARIVSMSDTTGAGFHSTSTDTVTGILLYLNRHMKENITLDQLSERFFLSKHHMNKVFRKATGTTVFDYLLHKRVTLAQQLLIEGSSAQEAAAEAGFGDYSSFYRAYTKILGHSPLQDRGVLPSLGNNNGKQFEDVNLRI